MKTINDLDDLVVKRIKEELNANPGHNGIYRMDHLFPGKEELKEFNTTQILIIIRKYDMLLPYCSDCTAVRPNGKWIPRENIVDVLTRNYKRFTHGYCLDCLEKWGVPSRSQ